MKVKPKFSVGVILAFITPYISIGSGLVVAWLFVHLHILGIFHVQQSQVATTIAGAVVFSVTAGLHYAAAHFHWLPIVLTDLKRQEAAKLAAQGGGSAVVSPGGTVTGGPHTV